MGVFPFLPLKHSQSSFVQRHSNGPAVLGLSRTNPGMASFQINLGPFQINHVALPESCHQRKLLKWAQIEREALQEWCERQGVPLPEFWFPPGWKLKYEWPMDEEEQKGRHKRRLFTSVPGGLTLELRGAL